MKLPGATILVSCGMKVLQAVPGSLSLAFGGLIGRLYQLDGSIFRCRSMASNVTEQLPPESRRKGDEHETYVDSVLPRYFHGPCFLQS